MALKKSYKAKCVSINQAQRGTVQLAVDPEPIKDKPDQLNVRAGIVFNIETKEAAEFVHGKTYTVTVEESK